MANERILIVEDDEKSRRLVRDVLRFKGYETVETETAEEGLRVAREARPALILMDIQLPGMNGIDALGCLRADPATRDIPVIAVTASAMTQDRKQILAAGFDAYQPKPIAVKAFLDAIRQTLDRDQARSVRELNQGIPAAENRKIGEPDSSRVRPTDTGREPSYFPVRNGPRAPSVSRGWRIWIWPERTNIG